MNTLGNAACQYSVKKAHSQEYTNISKTLNKLIHEKDEHRSMLHRQRKYLFVQRKINNNT